MIPENPTNDPPAGEVQDVIDLLIEKTLDQVSPSMNIYIFLYFSLLGPVRS
jgi:hypothetical protein